LRRGLCLLDNAPTKSAINRFLKSMKNSSKLGVPRGTPSTGGFGGGAVETERPPGSTTPASSVENHHPHNNGNGDNHAAVFCGKRYNNCCNSGLQQQQPSSSFGGGPSSSSSSSSKKKPNQPMKAATTKKLMPYSIDRILMDVTAAAAGRGERGGETAMHNGGSVDSDAAGDKDKQRRINPINNDSK
jgi:hypothetical protein